MNKQLLRQLDGQRIPLEATFAETRITTDYNRPLRIALLTDIATPEGVLLLDRYWCRLTQGLQGLCLEPGERLGFIARVVLARPRRRPYARGTNVLQRQRVREFCWSRDRMRRHRDYLCELDRRCPTSLHDITAALTGGRQVFPWAAGYGKTTALRQLICQDYPRGVLYAVRTQADADLLGYEIACFLIDRAGGPPAPQDHAVYILHSAARVFDEDLQQEIYSYHSYCANPEQIRDFPVLVTTHARLFLDPPQLLLNMCEDESPHEHPGRTYLIIDEKPNLYEKFTLDIHDMDRFRQLTGDVTQTRAAIRRLKAQYQHGPFQDIAARFLRTLADRELDLLGRKRAHHRAATIVEARRAQTVLITPQTPEQEERYTFLYHLGLLPPPHLLLFDGTGDLTLKGSRYWSFCPHPRLRYQFQGTVTRLAIRAIPRSVHRLETEHLALWQRDCRVVLNRIIRQHQQVLLVTWKDLKGTLEYVTQETLVDAEGEELPLDHTAATTLASHTYLPLYILRQLIEPELQPRVHVTHYQAGDTRGTNALKHCDAVIFLGRFYVHAAALQDLNHVEQAQVTQEDWLLAEVVQATYRSRIRTGHPIDVYFSQDFAAGFLTAFLGYTNACGADGRPLTWLTPATQLRALLAPDARSQHAYEFIASKAEELLRGEVVEYGIPQRYLTASERLDNFKRALRRVVADKALYVDLGGRRFSVQLRPEGFGG